MSDRPINPFNWLIGTLVTGLASGEDVKEVRPDYSGRAGVIIVELEGVLYKITVERLEVA